MTFPTTIRESLAVVFLQGRLSFRSYPDFKAATQGPLEDPAIREIHLDLAGVDHLDSSALGMILHLKQKADLQGKEIVLTRPSPAISTVLGVVNFGKFLRIEA